MAQRRIAVLTSGGDASGMNAAIRAVVRSALERGWSTFGVERGYAGLIDGAFRPLSDRDVGGILHRGGTMLGSARCREFATEPGRRRALDQLAKAGLDALVVIGGNGSQAGANSLAIAGFTVVGIASTIDNDLRGAEITIGVDTALGIALEAIDRLKVTASSHHRAFVIEVMGRESGYLALMAGIAGGAEAIAIPELPTSVDEVAAVVRAAYARGKSHAIVVVAEGVAGGGAGLAERLRAEHRDLGFDVRVTTLGHVQRGGTPGPFDRILGSRSGAAAIDALARGERGVMIGQQHGELLATLLAEVAVGPRPLDPAPLELARVLAR
jgi:6-phosphofructokinase 1